jgi:TetR/AcrR family transcriptional regulator, regulator of cefoperazone and chloramphenicol sensitivity
MVPPPHSFPDAADSRARLLSAALRLFAEHGFAKTSIRQIAEAAGANAALISYYFGDKKGLYNAAYAEPLGGPLQVDAGPDGQSLDIFLEQFITGFMRPLNMGDQVELCMRLHFREMLDPTGLWQQELEGEIKPLHATLTRLLCRAVGASTPDDDIHRLALAITALPLQYYANRELIQQMSPQLAEGAGRLQTTTRRLIDFAQHLIAGEVRRRQALPGDTP